MPRLKDPRHERFCHEFLVDLNQTQAAIRAKFAKRSARQTGARLMTRHDIQTRIAELQAAIEEKIDLKTEDILHRWSQIATADPNELTSIVYAACRYCHGADHDFQWKTEREFQSAHTAWLAKTPSDQAPEHVKRVHQAEEPDASGGTGFDPFAAPHALCPECLGRGVPQTVFRDTTNLSPAARLLFAGVKETRNGIEIKMHDQAAALDSIARHLGMFKGDTGAEAVSDLAAAIQQISQRGSAAPIAKPPTPQDEGEDP